MTALTPSASPSLRTAAYQANGLDVSSEVFYAIACDPQRSVVVEACAGAGKTWMLVSRILRALLEGAQPHEILAITFTRKAAGEMSARLHEWLREWANPAFTDAQRAQELRLRGMSAAQAQTHAPALAGLYERLLRGGRPVEVRTFHAWFSQLMRHAPLELLAQLGLQPGMALLENLDDHLSDIFRSFYQALLKDDVARADHATLVAQRGSSQVEKWLLAALAKRVELALADGAGALESGVPSPADQWPELTGLAHPAEVLHSAPWVSLLTELARELGQGNATAQTAAGHLVDALQATDAQQRYALAKHALFTNEGKPRKKMGSPAGLNEAHSELLRLDQQIHQHQAHQEHLRMVRLSRLLLAQLAHYKCAHGLADMGDLERCALHLLRDSTLAGWVQERLDARLRHVLIDEFQDTSPLQWQALKAWFSAYAGATGGVSGQRPLAVFVVGDPKQSIYRFRGADPRVFEEASTLVAEVLGGQRLTCDHTRRNAPEVIDAINTVFVAAQAQGDYPGFRAHTTQVGPGCPGAALLRLPEVLRPAKEKRARGAAPVRDWRDSLTEPRHEPEEALRQQEARWVALAVHELLHSADVQGTAPFKPSDVYVLSRKRESLRWAAQALQALHIPFVAAEDYALMDCAEVADLVAVLDALASPSHRLSLARCLRCPLMDASDDDLVALAALAGEDGDWWQALMRHAHLDRPALQRARRLLQSWHAAAQQLPPHDLLDRIVAEGDYRERVAVAVPAEGRLAALNAIDALLHMALTLDGARYATPYAFVRALKRRALKVAAPAQPDAVQLLTVHGAKGLEARAVFVMDTQPEHPKTETVAVLVDWPAEAQAPLGCAFVYATKSCPPSLQAALEQERQHQQREELNGLYVAMSRARERLVFSATEPYRSPDHVSWWQRALAAAQPWLPLLSGDNPQASALADTVCLTVLPRWTGGGAGSDVGAGAGDAGTDAGTDADTDADTDAEANPARTGADPTPAATPASRLGEAVHRVLEWATTAGALPADAIRLQALAQAAAREFDAPLAEVLRLSGQMLCSPTCAPFFSGPGLLWAGNEVAVVDQGELLRIDRLVALAGEGDAPRVWWVLDYKIATQPDAQGTYRAPMQRYRRAVQALQPGEPVRCALINGLGELMEIDDDTALP